MTTRTSARFSTYSGAPSIQPSLAPTMDSYGKSSSTAGQPGSTLATANKGSFRTSTIYPSDDASTSTASLSTTDPEKSQAIKSWSGHLERMQDARLDKQRYVMSSNKNEEVSALALGAKFERALSRRMVGQDAADTRRSVSAREGSGKADPEKSAAAAAEEEAKQ